MITYDQARELVTCQLDAFASDGGCESAILDDSTLERQFGWVFFYQSTEYLSTGNESFLLAGNAPIIVNRHNGQLIHTGTALPVEVYIAHYEASLAHSAA